MVCHMGLSIICYTVSSKNNKVCIPPTTGLVTRGEAGPGLRGVTSHDLRIQTERTGARKEGPEEGGGCWRVVAPQVGSETAAAPAPSPGAEGPFGGLGPEGPPVCAC